MRHKAPKYERQCFKAGSCSTTRQQLEKQISSDLETGGIGIIGPNSINNKQQREAYSDAASSRPDPIRNADIQLVSIEVLAYDTACW